MLSTLPLPIGLYQWVKTVPPLPNPPLPCRARQGEGVRLQNEVLLPIGLYQRVKTLPTKASSVSPRYLVGKVCSVRTNLGFKKLRFLKLR